MEQEILSKLTLLEGKVERLEKVFSRWRKYLLIGIVLYALIIILPLLGLALVLPYYLDTLNQALSF